MTTRHDLVVQAALALERMAFVIAEPVEVAPEAELQRASRYAAVQIGDDQHGFVLVAANDGFVREIASGMIGVDLDEVAIEEHGDATVLELANVLGGHAIHEADGDTSCLQLGLPRLVTRDEALALLRSAKGSGFAGVVAAEHGRLVLAGLLPGLAL